jgi:hypothetical protein
MKTIKKVFLNSLMLLCSALIPVCGFCFQNEPEGFGGIQWGTDISAVTNMILVLEKPNDPIRGDLKMYQKQNEVMTMGRATLNQVGYIFFKDKFISAQILTEGSSNFLGLKDYAFELFGKGEQSDQSFEQYFWFGNKSRIKLNYDKETERGSLSIVSTQYKSQYQDNMEQAMRIMGLYGR